MSYIARSFKPILSIDAVIPSIALLIALHFFGALGFNSTTFSSYFIALVPVNLILSTLLVFAHHKDFSRNFCFFASIVFILGMVVEIVGVQTSLIFGAYSYGTILGAKVLGVPLTIGLNWLLLIYCIGVVSHQLNMATWLKVVVGASIMLLLDIFIEPVAIQYAWWTWEIETVPLQNYVAWFIISAFLLSLFHYIHFNKHNIMAWFLLPVQALFFMLV